ncbi:MAG TPA: sialidase family protein [Fimbriimonadaceae bacterium]|jgi:hypothetical protein
MRLRLSLLVLAVAAIANAQWADVKHLGQGGESTVASDNQGNVYVTSHLPSSLFTSRDWGATFNRTFRFPDSLGDMFVLARPNGLVNVTFIRGQINGIASWYSTDAGRTMQKGENILGPLDREWVTADKNGTLFMDYSNGYIGGPKSKGLFMAESTNDGKSFHQIARTDQEPRGSYAVDPYIAISSTDRLYSMWGVSKDYDTIEAFRLSYSDDKGRHFSKPTTVATFSDKVDGEKVDIQERWMLGTFVAVGPKKLLVVYPEYKHFMVDGKSTLAFVLCYKYSEDGGQTFSAGDTALSKDEIISAIRTFEAGRVGSDPSSHYIQTLPWLCADKDQRIYLAFTDNRLGQTKINRFTVNKWLVRCATCFEAKNGFVWSDQVSHEYDSKRAPMDFLSCAADSKNLYLSWTENPGITADFPFGGFALFTGNLYVGRKKLAE